MHATVFLSSNGLQAILLRDLIGMQTVMRIGYNGSVCYRANRYSLCRHISKMHKLTCLNPCSTEIYTASSLYLIPSSLCMGFVDASVWTEHTAKAK